MMGPGDGYAGHVHPTHHPAMPMDLHVPQGAFPYYRYRNDAFCWPERKPGLDDMNAQATMAARQMFEQTGRYPPTGPTGMPILELRKEKSRDAARSRRGKENYEFYELAKMLPLPAAITSQLDKASIIRLTISFLKLKDFSAHGDPPWNRDNPTSNKKGSVRNRISSNPTLDLFEQHQGTHILQSLDGFAFSLAADGRFLYISETVSIYLGLSQVEMTGSSIFDYIHQQDHAELAEQLGLGLAHGAGANVPSPSAGSDDGSTTSTTNNPDVSSIMSMSSNASYKGLDRSFCVRMKSTLTKRGCHFKSSGYRVVLVLVKLRPQFSFSHTRKAPPSLLGAVGLAIALPPPSVHEIRLETDMFVTRLTFDFRIMHCEPRASELLDYTSEEMMGKNLYVLCHGEDVNKLRKCHVDLLSKGQVLSQYYRLMNKNGGYIWLQTCATVVCNSKNSDEQSIICVNYVISAKEYSNIVMDCCQLEEDCVPPVKREPLDERDRKSPDNDSSADGPGRGPHRFDSTAATSTKSSPGAKSTSTGSTERSPDLRESYQQAAREKRLHNNNLLHQRSAGQQLHKDGSVLPESQPLTPISTSTPDHIDAATPPPHVMPTPPATSTAKSGRKRKLTSAAAAAAAASSRTAHSAATSEELGIGAAGGLDVTHSMSSCSKRQIIVDPMDGPPGGTTTVHGSHAGPVTPVSVGHESGSSPHHSSAEADNSGDSARWRKVNHPSHWDGGSSSVKDLEQVMSKHLPGRGDHEHVGGIDFSADSLLRQQPGSTRGSSAIQYAGLQSGPGGLPVSALLRQLCASRESVIRANVQAAAAAAVVAARGASSYYPDMSTVQTALPTPPGSDNYESQFMLAASHQKSASSEFSSLVPYPSVSSYDYQPTMTPPSSVSPRDKPTYGDPNVAAYGGGDATSAGGATSFRPPQSYLDGPAQPLPLKPQVYGYHPHSSLESQYGNPLTDHSQTQFYPAPHTGFHLYHPTKPSANWYSSTT